MRDNEETSLAVRAALTIHQSELNAALDELRNSAGTLGEVIRLTLRTLRSGNKIMLAGNGGSAAEAQHFSAELVGRFRRDRAPYAAIALHTDSSILTAIGNDYGYEQIFSRQVLALGQPGDLLIAFSTSGESENLLRAAEAARGRAVTVVAITGPRPSRLAGVADVAVPAPGRDAATVQEIHTIITHLVCEYAESELSETRA